MRYRGAGLRSKAKFRRILEHYCNILEVDLDPSWEDYEFKFHVELSLRIQLGFVFGSRYPICDGDPLSIVEGG